MQNDTSQFLVNIVPLQNIQTNVSGLDSVSVLANDVAAIKRLVNTDTNKIFTNGLASYTTGGAISVTSPIHLCNVGITSNDINVLGTGSASATGTLSNLSSILTIYPSNGITSTVMNIATGSISSAVSVSEGGNLTVSGSGSFGGICYATQFVTLSDMLAKTGIREWRSPVLSDLQKIRPYIFKYDGSSLEDIGLMAQEIGLIWPQLIKEGVKGSYVNYDGIVALLLKAVQELAGRVSTLEGKP
jgi:hypothetical protein